jgi:hypothetical protein
MQQLGGLPGLMLGRAALAVSLEVNEEGSAKFGIVPASVNGEIFVGHALRVASPGSWPPK